MPQLLSLLSLGLVAVFDQLNSEKRMNFLESSSVDLALNPVPLLTSCLIGEIGFIIYKMGMVITLPSKGEYNDEMSMRCITWAFLIVRPQGICYYFLEAFFCLLIFGSVD